MNERSASVPDTRPSQSYYAPSVRQPTLSPTDLLIVGGGINGAGIALDAAGRGLSVRVVEQGDFASGTSSNSSKLIHGGLRYLEQKEFKLVKEALAERQVLLNKAPHLIKPMRFILPHRPHLRPAWMILCGLFLYDRMGGKSTLAKSKGIKFKPDNPLKASLEKGFEYTDCWVDDARLVIHNLIDVQKHAGIVSNYTVCTRAKADKEGWLVDLLDIPTGKEYQVRTTCLVNAAGPWAQNFIENKIGTKSSRKIRLIKGSHLILPRLYSGDQCYILQNEDKRIVFVIPYMDKYTIIGTTDKEHQGKPEDAAIDDQETDYLLKIYNDHFKKQIKREDIVSSYSGVRPLCDDESDDPSAITRDYTLSLEDVGAPLLNIFGGKLTTYRKLSEAALTELQKVFPGMQLAWTSNSTLPGGELSRKELYTEMQQRIGFVPEQTRNRWIESYGTLYRSIVKDARSMADLGKDLGGGLTEAEVSYLVRSEWARTPEDILKRRTKLYLTDERALAASVLKHLKETF